MKRIDSVLTLSEEEENKKKKLSVPLGRYLSPPAASCSGPKLSRCFPESQSKKSRRAREKVNRGPPAKNNRKLPLQQREQGLSTFRPKPGLDQRPSSSSSSSEPFTTLPFCHDQIFVTLSTIPFLGAPLESAGTTKPFFDINYQLPVPRTKPCARPSPSAPVQPERESHPFLSFPHLPHAGYHLT